MSSAPADELLRLGTQRVRVQVRGAGVPLLLLNGVGAPLELWQPLLPLLPGVQTIALDAPGSGGSSTPRQPLSVAGHARTALQVLDALGVQRAAVLGFSFGGMVAQELARLAGPRLERLVLASTTCGWGGVPGTPAALLAISTPDRYYSRALFEAEAPTYMGGAESADAAFLREQGRLRVQHPPDRRGYLYQCWAAATWSSLPWLRTVAAPALVLTGDADPLVPAANSRILAGVLPQARLHVLRGGGHLCLLERAAEVAPVLGHFLS